MKGSRASALVSPEGSQKTRGPSQLHHMGSEVPQNALHQSKGRVGQTAHTVQPDVQDRVPVEVPPTGASEAKWI